MRSDASGRIGRQKRCRQRVPPNYDLSLSAQLPFVDGKDRHTNFAFVETSNRAAKKEQELTVESGTEFAWRDLSGERESLAES